MEIWCWNIEKSPGNFRIFIAILAVTELILKQKFKLEQELHFDWYVICLISWLPSMKKTPHSNTVSPYRLASFAFAQCKLIFAVIEIVLNLFTIEFFDYFFFNREMNNRKLKKCESDGFKRSTGHQMRQLKNIR